MPKRKCTFNEELQKKFPLFKKGKFDWEILCTICNSNISIANKGVTDINEHIATLKHKTRFQSQAGSSKVMETYITKPGTDDNIRAAEGAIAFHTVTHHMSFNSLDCTNSLNKELFSESNTAKKLSCNRSKAIAIVNNVLAPLSTNKIINDLQNIVFVSVSVDASNHGSIKLIPIIIQYFDYRANGITSKLLEIETAPDETSNTISDLIIKQLKKFNILSKCIAFSGDNCNTNFGGKQRLGTNNVFTKLKSQLQNNIMGVGCSAHIINNAVQHGCDILPVDVESIILKIYNYFSIYTVRTEALKEFCIEVDSQYRQLLYHSRTRWLSLFPAIERILQLYEPLKNYFEQVEKPPVAIKQFFETELSELYMFLIHSTMNIFHTRIEKLEKNDNSIIETRKILLSIIKNLEERITNNFVPIKVLNNLKNFDTKIKEDFLKNSISFYKEIKNYIESWIKPLDEFIVFEWMDLVTFTEDISWSTVQSCISFLNEKNIVINDIQLFDEWINLRTFCKELTEQDKKLNSNELWLKFFKTSNADSYTELIKIAQYFFSIPAHNASIERIFSLITAQWTKERNALVPNTISSLIKLKYNFKNFNCCEFYHFLQTKKEVLIAIGTTDKYKKKLYE